MVAAGESHRKERVATARVGRAKRNRRRRQRARASSTTMRLKLRGTGALFLPRVDVD